MLLYKKEDTCVCQMVKKLQLKNNLVSHHLKTLQDLLLILGLATTGQQDIYTRLYNTLTKLESL